MKSKVFFSVISALILSGCASSQSLVLNQYKSEYPRPQYVSASSCLSGKDALRNLVEQLQVTVDASSLLVQKRTNLTESTTAKNVVRLRSGEHLRGLIVRHFGGHCVFVAIDKKNATESYQRDVKEESQKIGHLFAKLEEPGATSLEKLRSAKKLESILKTLRADHDALELLSEDQVHRLHIPAYRMRELAQSRGFAVSFSGPAGDGFSTMLENAVQSAGYKVMDPMSDPAFALNLQVTEQELPLDARNPVFPYVITFSVAIQDKNRGKLLLTRQESKSVTVNSPQELSLLVYPRLAQEVRDSVVVPALQALGEKRMDKKTRNGGRDF